MNDRPIEFIEHASRFGEGHVQITAGQTIILATASLSEGTPRFLQNQNQGWITAEYSMLPRATHQRNTRDSQRGKISPRSSEIQRLIGRALRASVNLKHLGNHTITIDCDVLQADGSTRTHAINAGQIALIRAIQKLQIDQHLKKDPLQFHIAAISAGMLKDEPLIDLDYAQDSQADLDMNIVMNEKGDLIEIQGTAEGNPFSRASLNKLLDLAWPKISAIIDQQKRIVETPYPYTAS